MGRWRFLLTAVLLCFGAVLTTAMAQAAPDIRSATAAPADPIIIRPGRPFEMQQEQAGWPPSELALAKTLSFRGLSAVDALATMALFGWFARTNLSVVGLATLSSVYLLHDWVWTSFGPVAADAPVQNALMRTVSYRITVGTVAAVTGVGTRGDFTLMGASWIGDMIVESVLFTFHEVAWSLWGPPVASGS